MRFTFRSFSFSFALFLIVLAFAAVGCAAPAAPPPIAPQPDTQPAAAPAMPTSAPAASVDAGIVPAENSDSNFDTANAAPIDRRIIKNAQLALTVQNTATAIFEITGISSDVGGYVVGSRTFGSGNQTGAQISIAVPVDRFEEAVNMVRHTALAINQDTTTTAEVTEQFVDLEARLKNLDATAARLRDFLARADTITDTLSVNQELTRVESEAEQIKGKLNALDSRTAFSIIAVDLSEPPPAPVPASPPPSVVWHPEEIFGAAAEVQTKLFQALVTLAIWFSVALLPYLVAALLVGLAIRTVARRLRRPAAPRAR